jgi:hypothetical protein
MTEYGGWSEVLEDGATWKASGLTCVDGVLYLSVSRHFILMRAPFPIQESWDSSIVKSLDRGKTWSPAPRLGKPMFPGKTMANPFFVEYGRDGHAGPDGSEVYVYAVSNDGSWNNGNSMSIGRVRRDRISRLEASDWEFFAGFEPSGRPAWKPRHDTASFMFWAPGRTSMTGVHYIAGLGLYIMPQWSYPRLGDPTIAFEEKFRTTRLEFWQAPAPWGPWSLFHDQEFHPQSWYNPCLPSKFIAPDGRSFWIFVSGDWTACDAPDTLYRLTAIPVKLEVRSTPEWLKAGPGARGGVVEHR